MMPSRTEPHPTRPAGRPPFPAGLLALLLLAATAGCRYQDYGAMGVDGPAPFVALRCFEPDNPGGFSFEVPGCACQAGMRLRYLARPRAEPPNVRFEFETNFLDDDPNDDVRMMSSNRHAVEHVFIGRRELPAGEAASASDRAQWAIAREMWESMFRHYEPVLRRAHATCTADRNGRRRRSPTPR
ncbi:MAG: hypothetical protein GYA57_04565 [Myxococcales bacterium]|nr:hypothetical protein [Myxococcales bacterium]